MNKMFSLLIVGLITISFSTEGLAVNSAGKSVTAKAKKKKRKKSCFAPYKRLLAILPKSAPTKKFCKRLFSNRRINKLGNKFVKCMKTTFSIRQARKIQRSAKPKSAWLKKKNRWKSSLCRLEYNTKVVPIITSLPGKTKRQVLNHWGKLIRSLTQVVARCGCIKK